VEQIQVSLLLLLVIYFPRLVGQLKFLILISKDYKSGCDIKHCPLGWPTLVQDRPRSGRDWYDTESWWTPWECWKNSGADEVHMSASGKDSDWSLQWNKGEANRSHLDSERIELPGPTVLKFPSNFGSIVSFWSTSIWEGAAIIIRSIFGVYFSGKHNCSHVTQETVTPDIR
jgi:hypothetical protein